MSLENFADCGICQRQVSKEDTRYVFDPFALFKDNAVPQFEICPDCLTEEKDKLKMVPINDDRFMGHAVYVYIEEE